MKSLHKTCLAIVFLAAAGCSKPPAPVPERPPPKVTTTKAIVRDVPVYLDEIGRCVAPEIVSIQPQVSGKIVAIHFKEGADLKKGDKLFTIDPRPYQAQLDQAAADLELNQASLEQSQAGLKQNQALLEQAQAALGQSRARLTLNQSEFERDKALLENNAVSRQEYDSKQMAVTVGESQVSAALAAVAVTEAQIKQSTASIAMAKAHIGASKAAITMAELNLEYTSILSPIDGRAGQRLADVGNVVTANSGTLLVIQRLDPIYADFTIPESELAKVRNSMSSGELKVECRIPGETQTQQKPHEGVLTFLDSAVQDGTGTVKLRATIANADRYFWPGQFVNVRLIVGIQKEAILVPTVASQVGQAGTFLYTIKPDSTADLRPVKLGQRHGELIVAEGAIAAGEDVVVTGQLMLYPGAKVSIDTPAAPEKAGGK